MLLRLKSVIYNPLKSICLFCGARYQVDSTTLVTGNSTKPVPRLSPHYRSLVLSALVLALCAVPLSVANAASITLAWSANDEPDLEGYVVYHNRNSPGPPYRHSDTVFEDELENPLRPEVSFYGLSEGREYYIALTAFNSDGVESDFSDEICARVVDDTIKLCEAIAGSSVTTTSIGGGSGGSGSSRDLACFISAASHSPPDKNFLLYILFSITAIGLGTYGYKIRR